MGEVDLLQGWREGLERVCVREIAEERLGKNEILQHERFRIGPCGEYIPCTRRSSDNIL